MVQLTEKIWPSLNNVSIGQQPTPDYLVFCICISIVLAVGPTLDLWPQISDVQATVQWFGQINTIPVRVKTGEMSLFNKMQLPGIRASHWLFVENLRGEDHPSVSADSVKLQNKKKETFFFSVSPHKYDSYGCRSRSRTPLVQRRRRTVSGRDALSFPSAAARKMVKLKWET